MTPLNILLLIVSCLLTIALAIRIIVRHRYGYCRPLAHAIIGLGAFLIGIVVARQCSYDQRHTLGVVVMSLIAIAGVISLAAKAKPRISRISRRAFIELAIVLLGISATILCSSERALLGLMASFGLLYLAVSELHPFSLFSPSRGLFRRERK